MTNQDTGQAARPVELPEANGVECADCPGFGNYYDLSNSDPTVPLAEDDLVCPIDAEHVVTAVYLTREPLGWPDDPDYLVHGRGQYAYPTAADQ